MELPRQPLADAVVTAIAAGNRVMLKLSKFAPRTNAVLDPMVREVFPANQVTVVSGDGSAFSALPFDHLVFTGRTTVGKSVMNAASEHLVPVTLELGGKSPSIVAKGQVNDRAVSRGYTAGFPEHVIQAHHAFIERRRQSRSDHEFRRATAEGWGEFEQHFLLRRVALGTCHRPYATACVHEPACVKCRFLQVDPAQTGRLETMSENAEQRLAEAREHQWLGKVSALKESLIHLRRGRDEAEVPGYPIRESSSYDRPGPAAGFHAPRAPVAPAPTVSQIFSR